ncbi:MAG: hypothetical protein UU78_C0057G0003 [Candidatus Roizmanbacteria bacterium GW2011_GWC2_41_7]|uniref:Amidohydrolase-related domain-containing protein n=1 Tax=Candidatus Roizmanbacteria bacterium GW2011_GWC2_41_7 TaxID=1618487 RepID=A0A0G1A5L0_9BACT|nr:MAG: hypothetical protein UU78_C0057G0003 [Candidatus Roizmanbacteria bacterium GW2011_GWC2_41_7]
MKTVKLPGLIDPHVHLRDPGATHKEDFESGTKAAVAGGFVMVLDMPNNPEPTITVEALEQKKRLVKEKAVCDVGFIFGASSRHPERAERVEGSLSNNDNTSEFEKVIDDVYALKVYMDTTTGNLLIEEEQILENIFNKWPSHKPIVVHAEREMMNRAIDLAKKFNNKLHIAHLSQRSELEQIIQEKEKGFTITCEVTPHHLFLTEKDAVALGPYGTMKPPLKSKQDVDFLWKHIDAIDCIATDHAPHTKEEKESDNPPFGVPGLETSLPLMLTAVSEGRITIDDIVRLMHKEPQKIFGIDVVRISDPRLQNGDTYIEVDTNAEYTIENKNLFTKCGWSTFDGMKVKGKIVRTVIRGRKVFESE